MIAKRSQSRIAVVAITLIWSAMEWLLFELRRAPYRPPHDMKTLLGTERDGVFYVMAGTTVGWVIVLYWICLRSEFTRKDYANFGLMIALLTAIIGGFVLFPCWPVTPYELLWS